MLDGKQVLLRRVVRELHSPQVNFSSSFGPLKRFACGLGWNLADYEGDLVVQLGGLGGAYAHVSFMPDQKLGVAVLSNGGGGRIADTLAYYVYDSLLGKPDRREVHEGHRRSPSERRESALRTSRG